MSIGKRLPGRRGGLRRAGLTALTARLSSGDPLEVVCQGDEIILRPQIHVPRDQSYFWTKEWQDGEREAEEEIKAVRVRGPFRTVKEMKRFLKKT